MAGLDASIYNNVGRIEQPQNPLAQLAQVEQIKRYQQIGEKEARTNALMDRRNALMASPDFQGGDATRRANMLYGAGDIEGAGRVTTSAAAAAKDTREAEKFQLEADREKWTVIGQVAGTVNDQPSYERGLGILQQRGIDTSKFNPTYDPAGVKQFADAAMTRVQQIESQYKERGFGEQQRHNLATEATGARTAATGEGNLAVSQQGLALRQQELAAGKVPSGYERGPDGALRPQVGGPADPAAKGFKLTEDQGKATGWLVQAEQAFKNLEAVGFDKKGNATDAARPGFGDALASATWIPGAEAAGNWMRGADRQKFLQAAESASEALLRAATGAGVNKDEARQKARELIPQWGEDDATIAQKRAAYPLYLESLRIRAGPGAAQAGQIAASAPPPGGTPAKPPAGKTVVRIGTKPDGRKVAQYSDGTSGYVD